MAASLLPRSVRIIDVSARDGLQNVKQRVATRHKVELILLLRAAGFRDIELTSAVSPKAIPQLADCQDVLSNVRIQSLMQDTAVRAITLVPNARGLDVVRKSKGRAVAVFVSASQGFSRANIQCDVETGLQRAQQVTLQARAEGMQVRGYVSCIFACPFDGRVAPESVLKCVNRLLEAGCYEVSLGDTTGVGCPSDVNSLLDYLVHHGVPIERLAGHFHDTYGQALANVWAAMGKGLSAFDSSVAGLGGCPYAPGAKGNLASEDLVYSLHKAGIATGVDYDALVEVGRFVDTNLGLGNHSRAGTASLSSLALKASSAKPLHWSADLLTDELEVHRSGRNLRITLNRPKNGNALTRQMITAIIRVFESTANDSSISRIIIKARGRFFCTGMDLGKGTSNVAQGSEQASDQYSLLTGLFETIDKSSKVTIACVQGPAFGGGVGLAFACDIRLMAESASIRLTEVRLGLVPATIFSIVIRELGVALTREVMLTGRVVPATQLSQLGKVDLCTEDLDLALESRLKTLRNAAPGASGLIKDLVRWSTRESEELFRARVKDTFHYMMAGSKESAYGLSEFQRGVKDVDWDSFEVSRDSRSKL